MSVKIIAQLHPFSNDRIEIDIEKDTIKCLINQIAPDITLSSCRILFDDEIITDFERIPDDGQTVFIKVVPQGDGPMAEEGGKMAGWGGVLMALGVVALFIPGLGGLGAALIGPGLALMVGGAVLANYEPDRAKSRGTPDHDPSIRGSKNQARQHGYIPVILGRHLISPDFAAAPVTAIEGNDQYLVQLFCAGYNNIEIETGTLKIGDTLLADYSASKSLETVLAGNDSTIKIELLQNGEESTLYPRVCRETSLNQILKNRYDDGTDGAIIRTTPSGTTKVNIDIFFYNGLGEYDDDGDLHLRSVTVLAYIKKSSDPDSEYLSLGVWSSGSNTITAAYLKTLRYQITKENLNPDSYTIKFIRATGDTSDSKIIDDVYVGSIRAYTDDRPVKESRAKSLALIALKVKATDRLNGTIDTFNFVAQSNLPVFSGTGTGSSAWQNVSRTSNPAAILRHILQGQINCDPVQDSHIDWASIEAWYTWCALKNYTCNVVISDKIQISDLLSNIGKTARAECVKIDSRFSIIQDTARPSPVQLFTPRNTKNYQQTIAFSDIPDALEMSFIDAESDFQENQRLVYNTNTGEYSGTDPKVKQKADLWGVTNAQQAYLIGRYNYACMLLRPRIHKIELDLEYLLSRKGDWIKYAGDTALVGTAYGRVRSQIGEGSTVTGVIVDEKITIEAGEKYALRIRKSDGELLLINVLTNAGYTNELFFESPVDDTESPGTGDLFTFGIREKESLDLLITDITPSDDWNATLTCVDYSPDIFHVDDDGYVIPQFVSKLTTRGVVDSGVINPRDWTLYQTYNDTESEPSAPIGDGTENGWHRTLTAASKWVSSKTAKSASDGLWGAPIKTTTLVIKETDTKLSDRPSYTEIATGFTAAGLVIIPAQLKVTAVGGFRFITITWSKQSNLSNLKEYQVQCSEDAITWYAPSFDGSGLNGHGAAIDGVFATTSPMLVHPNIPPAGTTDSPTGRLLYYRVRQRTALESYSEWSAVVAATTKLADSGDYAANSISLNALKTSELYALFATLSETLIIDPNAGLAAQNANYMDGDSRTVLNAKELLFQYVVSGSWVTIVRLALEGLCANQVYSKDKLVITNNTMAGRRAHGYDIGLAYLSANSHVCHYDSDLLDQTGAAYWTLTGSGALVGKDDGIPPAIVAVAPYATEAKSLFGNFRLQKNIGVANTFTLDFWIRYYYNENQELFRVGSASEYVSIDVLNSEPYYNEDSFQYNDEISSATWYNEIQGAVARVVYYLNGVYDIRYIQDAQGHPALTTGTWYHIGVIDSGSALVVLVNTTRFSFASPSVRTESITIDINSTLGQFLVDELFVDATVAETEAAFIANTAAKKPWAKLSDANDWFVFDVKDPAYLKTNIWESQGFRDAVLSIAAPKV